MASPVSFSSCVLNTPKLLGGRAPPRSPDPTGGAYSVSQAPSWWGGNSSPFPRSPPPLRPFGSQAAALGLANLVLIIAPLPDPSTSLDYDGAVASSDWSPWSVIGSNDVNDGFRRGSMTGGGATSHVGDLVKEECCKVSRELGVIDWCGGSTSC